MQFFWKETALNLIPCLFALILTGGPETPRFDACLVMLPGIPAQPWDGLTDQALEEMWTLDISGYQITMSGWSGYLLKGPSGTSETMLAMGAVLARGYTVPDSSGWARLLQLSWRDGASPCVLEYPFAGGDTVLPLRYSALLSASPDTIIVSAPINNSVLLKTGVHDSLFSGSAWRGVGLEVIPSDWGGVPVLLAFSFAGSPGELDRLDYHHHPYDSVWAAGFGALLAAVDSLSAPLAHTPEPTLVWIRGSGGVDFSPWTFIPSPTPPLRSTASVAAPETLVPNPWTHPPGAMLVTLPGKLRTQGDAEQTAAILERMITRMVLVDYDHGVGISGVSGEDGEVLLFLENSPWASPGEALEEIVFVLGPLAFTAPEDALLGNSAVRASIRMGLSLDPFSPRRAAESVARALGLL